MGLFSWLFGTSGNNPQPAESSSAENVNFLRGRGEYGLEVVEESHYQFNLKSICGEPTEDGENKQVLARLFLEDSNPHDKNAVRIEVEGLTVGYMSRDTARSFRKRLKEVNIPDNGLDWACYAVIRGGWDDGEGDRGYYGVWLDIPIEE